MDTKRKKVAVLIEATRGHERKLLRGIARYAQTKGNWIFYLDKLDPFYKRNKYDDNKILTESLINWGIDGVITRYRKNTLELQKKGIPVLHAIQRVNQDGPPGNIELDNEAIGKMGAEHLITRGFKNFGFCGLDEMFWSKTRQQSFSKKIIEVNLNAFCYKQPQPLKKLSWDIEQVAITKWLSSLPRPIGIMACNDDRAEHVIEGCKLSGLNVPEDVAVIGVDNDELVCEFSDPPLSSIALNSEKGGFEIAELLDSFMKHTEPSSGKIVVRPTHVAVRQSTNILAIKDQDVAKAIAFIRKNSHTIIQVEDIAEHVGIGLRILQAKFQKHLTSSIRDEIKRVRLNAIKKLLRETQMTVSQIAFHLGYSSDHNLARFFRKEMNVSPMTYRRENT